MGLSVLFPDMTSLHLSAVNKAFTGVEKKWGGGKSPCKKIQHGWCTRRALSRAAKSVQNIYPAIFCMSVLRATSKKINGNNQNKPSSQTTNKA